MVQSNRTNNIGRDYYTISLNLSSCAQLMLWSGIQRIDKFKNLYKTNPTSCTVYKILAVGLHTNVCTNNCLIVQNHKCADYIGIAVAAVNYWVCVLTCLTFTLVFSPWVLGQQ